MKRKMLAVLMITCALATVVGCTSTQEASVEEPGYEDIAPSFEDTSDSEDKEESAPSEDAESEENAETAETEEAPVADVAGEAMEDGKWSAYLQASDKDKAGVVSEAGEPQTIVYAASIDGDVLKVSGVMGPELFDPTKMTENKEYTLKLTDSTVYEMSGGDTGPETVTKDKFAEYLTSCIDSGLLFNLEVKGGEVVSVKISA